VRAGGDVVERRRKAALDLLAQALGAADDDEPLPRGRDRADGGDDVLEVRLVALQQIEGAERRARTDELLLDVGEAAVDQQPVAGQQQGDAAVAALGGAVGRARRGGSRRCAPGGRAQKFSTIAL